MGVIQTAEWLRRYYRQPEKLCEKFTKYIPLQKERVYRFLISKGMYRPVIEGEKEIQQLEKKRIWEELAREYEELKKWLNGPDIPIFILLSDSYNRTVQQEYNGKAGLTMRHVIFLFVSGQNTIEELKALLTHEYHHICRLHRIEKQEIDYTLLDTMIMEGLAEQAVYERHSETYCAPWTLYFSKEEAVRYWERVVKEKHEVKRGTREHDWLLNGLRMYPNMLGYGIGFHIVKDCVQLEKFSTVSLLSMDATSILNKASSFIPH
ncbi:DUF2268 domain-containing putative Zn-dependent protease [Bacillus sp. DX1.1]|uniref:DUF2268 domain-containing protein n=1 Tax=unclassified Bacillus (in: firmicutes) TaxID=185979 RepID=UPI002570C5BA|nr:MULTISPECIES: DUF2268 domain-containing putative Zn-dependent protease [unclassified Bacillus (in: firmicutes)]MDM5153825.1 DUF2268 domain-containing putative Zn-dependent protease [Bacillus sp. DX1.1]WJE82761.1 DUF2268 domain-containing putative Zn-dependent protease [Bacillus sp. DX3.1]